MTVRIFGLGLVLIGVAAIARAEGPTAAQVEFFEKSVRPVLVEHCFKCHGAEKQWANLRLDSREGLLKGGDRGPAIVPGKPDESLLVEAVRQTDESLKMPPKSRLTDQQIADLSKWVEQGAAYPAPVATGRPKRDPNHWAFQRPVDTPAPAVKDLEWSRSTLDRFILAKLEAAGLRPAATADRRTLIRRATFDLTGLPPTPDEVAAFLADESPEAFARVVERLLASPAYGERWGRHWLDIARYADSNGLDENVCHGNAWKYRDYVVGAFNRDKPFDQFIREQLAGDLLPAESESVRHEQLTATGFLVLGAKVLAEVDEAKMQMDIVDEQIEATGRAFLGLTLGCARCHDHKFDPIQTADYYALAGVFKSTQTMDTYTKVAKWHENPLPTPEDLALKTAHDQKVADKKAILQKLVTEADAQAKAGLKPGDAVPEKLETLYPEATKAELKKQRDELAALEKAAPVMPSSMGVAEGKVLDVAIHVRGNPLKLGDVVPRRTPAVFGPSPAIDAAHSGRLELANWLTDGKHPLTARVMVNRVWRWHFGRGLVRSTDNFGLLGELPTHPELLDWLAQRFVEHGWSLKWLHREILLSAVWQQSSVPDPQTAEKDPENRLWGRANIRRLEAEAVRDSLLAVGGRLDRTLGGTLVKVKNREYFFDHTSLDHTDYHSQRRSLYLPVVRNNVYDVFQLLDFPDPAVPSSDRATTTVAPQALLMMNSELVSTAAEDFAKSLRSGRDEERLSAMYQTAYGRGPTDAELADAKTLLADVDQSLRTAHPDADKRRLEAWTTVCQVILAANEFVYVR